MVWEWTGAGGLHDVAHDGGAFESELTEAAGTTFEHTFGSPGTFKYACTPHADLGMNGVVLVE